MNDNKQELLNNLLKLAEKEQKSGNKSITQDKLNHLSNYIIENNKKSRDYTKYSKPYPVPKSEFSPLFDKFKLKENKSNNKREGFIRVNRSKLQKIERVFINILEALANILDNLHLFSKFPMFPEKLLLLLKQTNKLWVLILIFLVRKTISQLLNVIRKQNKVNVEMKLLKSPNDNLQQKYDKILKDLKFDKTMLILELFGNILDLMFNIIELTAVPVPNWLMNGLNFTSMFMTIYRMNKDDEYVDDDITEDLI